MRHFKFAGLLALLTAPFIGCCGASSCLVSGGPTGCTQGYTPGCTPPAMNPALPPVNYAAGGCNPNCDATLQQGYLCGYSFGNAVSCGVKQVLAVPLAAATFVGGTAEALLCGIGSCGSLNFAQTTSTISNNCCSDYSDQPCTCDACDTSASIMPMQIQSAGQIPSYPLSVEGCAPCAAPSYALPMESYPVPAPPSYTPVPNGAQGEIPLSPTAQPIGVPIPRDANNSSPTTYIFPNRGSVMANSF